MQIKTTSKVNIKEARKALLTSKASIAQAHAQSSLKFTLVNTAKDVTARNPKHRIFYYDAVTNGRVAIKAGNNQTNRSKELHFRTGPGKKNWIVTKNVRRAKPLRITQHARDAISASLPKAVVGEFAKIKGLPMGEDCLRAFATMKVVVIREFRDATNVLTRHDNTKSGWYGAAEAHPLAESFKAINGKVK